MEATSQATRMHQELRNGEGKFVSSRDRLSSLPDPILCHILSFLPTKFSVATSILAKRWRSLWTDVPNLDFRMELEPDPTRFGDNLSYSDVINRVTLMNNVRNLNTFRFIYMNSWNDDHQFSAKELDTWFRTAIARNVQVVDLDFFFAPLPRCLFTTKTIVELKLLRCASIPLSGDVCLPSLRKLYLHDIDFGKEEAFYNLISGCPVLEELTIDGLYLDGVYCYKISSPTIKWLLLDLYLSHEKEHHFELEINPPALKYLSIKDDLDPCYVSAGTLNSLAEADIQLNSDYVREVVGYSCSIIQFVERLCQVKCLRLSSYFMEFLESDFAAATSRFYNLTKLELDADWRFLIKFLKCADNLEVLIIREVEKDLKCWTDPEHVPICLSSHLRHVTVDTHGYLEDEFKMVSYILRFAKVLNTMEICAKRRLCGSRRKDVILERISLCELASQTCKLVVLETN